MKYAGVLLALCCLAGCSQLATEDSRRPVSQSSAVDSLYAQGQEHRHAGDLQKAQASFERALRIEPSNARLWYELAQLAYEQNRLAEAEELALRAQAFAGDDRGLSRKINKLLRRVAD